MGTAAVILLAIVAIAIVLVLAALKKPEKLEGAGLAVVARRLMTGTEAGLLGRLREALPDHVVLAQVALSQLVEPKDKKNQALRNKINPKVVDFVVLRPDLSVLAVIELDGSSHDQPKRQRSDTDKGKLLAAADYALHRFNAKALPSAEELRGAILGSSLIDTAGGARHP